MRLPYWLLRLLPMWDYICPRCRREVKRNSHKCPFCGERFPFSIRVPPKILKNREALERYVHEKVFPKLDSWQREYLTQFFTTIFAHGFDCGSFTCDDQGYGGWTGYSGATIVSTPTHHGAYAAKLSGNNHMFYKDISLTSIVYMRIYFRLEGTTADWRELQHFRNTTNGEVGSVYIYYNGASSIIRMRWRDGAGNAQYQDVTVSLSVDTWYSLEFYMKIDASAGEAKVWLDGVLKNNVTGVNNTGRGNINRVYVWQEFSNSLVYYVDCVVIADAYIGPEAVIKQWSQIGRTVHTLTIPTRSFKMTQTNITTHTFLHHKTFKLTNNLNTIHTFLHHKIFKLINSLNTSHVFLRHKFFKLTNNLNTIHTLLRHQIFKLTQALRTLSSWTLPIPATLKQWFATLQTTHVFRRPLRIIMLAQTLRTAHTFLHHKMFTLSQTLRMTHVFTRPFRFLKLTQNVNLTHVLRANKFLKFITQILKPLHNWIKRTFGGFPFKIAVEERYPVNISAEAAEKIKVTTQDREPIKIIVEEMVE